MNSQVAAFAAFAVVAALLTVTPGVDTVLVLRTAVASGRRTALVAGAGVLTGLLVWSIAAGLGVAAVLAASTTAYNVLRVAGAMYLVGLGVRMLWRAARGQLGEHEGGYPPGGVSLRVAYVQGLLTNLLNPKVGVFYVTLLPQFIVVEQRVLLVCLGLALVHIALGVLWFLAVCSVAARLGSALRRGRARRVLDAVVGTVFVGFAARLALEARA